MKSKSTRSAKSRKANRPEKPYEEFPLSPHASGKWQKKVNGTTYYFGRWGKLVDGKLERIEGDGAQLALALYKAQIDDIKAGRTPRAKIVDGKVIDKDDRLSVADLCDAFIQSKERLRDSGEITPRTWDELKATTDRLVSFFGAERRVDDLDPVDFEKLRADVAKNWGPVRLGNEVGRVRSIFKYGFESELMEKPLRFGPQFVKPTKSVMRRHKATSGEKMLEPDEIHKILKKATPTMRAMILLAANCGLGNHDVATLPLTALDLETGWLMYPRPKTGIPRRAALWPETVDALTIAIAARPVPRQDGADKLVFLTRLGRQWLTKGVASLIAAEFTKLRQAVGVKKAGCGFYSLRHTFRTVADEVKDTAAIDLVMGHSDPSMADRYRERIADDRLRAVADHVRAWLYAKVEPKDGKPGVKGDAPEGAPALRIVG